MSRCETLAAHSRSCLDQLQYRRNVENVVLSYRPQRPLPPSVDMLIAHQEARTAGSGGPAAAPGSWIAGCKRNSSVERHVEDGQKRDPPKQHGVPSAQQ